MKKKRILSILLIVMMCLTACSQSHKQEKQTEHTESFFAMDTYLLFTAYGENAEKELLKVKEKIMELEQKWSVTDENSEIYAINHSGGQKVEVSEETNELISFALDMAAFIFSLLQQLLRNLKEEVLQRQRYSLP